MAAFKGLRGEGLVEYILVLSLFVLAAIGTVGIFGDNLRALFGLGASPQVSAPANPGTVASQ